MHRLILIPALLLAGCTTPRITIQQTADGYEARAPRAGEYALTVTHPDGTKVDAKIKTGGNNIAVDYLRLPIEAVKNFAAGIGAKLGQ